MLNLRAFALTFLLALSALGRAELEPFEIEDVRLQGLQRVSAGSVFSYLTLQVGSQVDSASLRQAMRNLFSSGFFDDIRIYREDGGVLIVLLRERPTIESIEIEGNKSIKTEALTQGLADSGLAEDKILQRATLDRVELDLRRQYVAQGRYAASIDAQVEDLPRNRVAIKIDIEEGGVAGVVGVNLVGNKSFSDAELQEVFDLKQTGAFSWLIGDNKYSREKLGGDLERLESFYLDRGYINFAILSTQVSLAPDKKAVYVTVHMEEGERHVVSSVELVGDLGDLPAEPLMALFLIQEGDIFSADRITQTEKLMTSALSNFGYSFATVSGVPSPGEEAGKVAVRFFVETGQRAYVRRIEFTGNHLTKDRVLRQEMRQFEGGWVSNASIERSKFRLEQLGFFQAVNVETTPVENANNQVDLLFSVEEQPSGSIAATLGYSQARGALVSGNYQESNFLGTGKAIDLSLNWSKFRQSLNMVYFNPYYTMDGVSRRIGGYIRRTDYGADNLVGFLTDSYGASFSFGYPVNERQRVSFGVTVDNTEILTDAASSGYRELSNFIENEGREHQGYKVQLAWSRNTLNRGLFATDGNSQYLGIQGTLPGSDLEYYKLAFNGQWYFPMGKMMSLRLRTELGYGNSYGKSNNLPFYENFFAGGFGTVRGFERNSLGPLSTRLSSDPMAEPVAGRPIGGNLLMIANIELVMHSLYEKQTSFRPALFFDVGQVFDTKCGSDRPFCFGYSKGELRYSIGGGFTWLSPMGPMTFSLTKPFNVGESDETETFQFEIGRTF